MSLPVITNLLIFYQLTAPLRYIPILHFSFFLPGFNKPEVKTFSNGILP